MPFSSRAVRMLVRVLLVSAGPVQAADLVVRVVGPLAPGGEIGCALFADADGFPMDNAAARQLWLPATAGASCRYSGLPDGRYAVSVSHDRNGNHRVDTNLFGIPTEAWGVSNNVRPKLRPPRFEEAAFTLRGDDARAIDVQVLR